MPVLAQDTPTDPPATAGAVSTGGKGFLKFQSTNYAVPADLYKQFKDGYAQTAKCNADNDKSSNSSFAASSLTVRAISDCV